MVYHVHTYDLANSFKIVIEECILVFNIFA